MFVGKFLLNAFENEIFLITFTIILLAALATYLYTVKLLCDTCECSENYSDALTALTCEYTSNTKNWFLPSKVQQSPVNFLPTNQRKCAIDPIIWEHHDVFPSYMKLENDGETVTLHTKYARQRPTVHGASLPAHYSFVNISFRWGATNKRGADHMLDNRSFPLEAQVLYRTGPEGELLSSYDALMIAYVFELGAHNPHLDFIVKSLRYIRRSCSRFKIQPNVPLSAIIPTCGLGFYSYIGSLTVPPYCEGVRWLVYSKPLSVSPAQLSEFQQLLNNDGTPIKQIHQSARKL